MPTSEQLRERAMTAVRAGNFTGARAMLARARDAAAGDVDQLAAVEMSEAYVEAETTGSATGLAHCRALLDTPGISEHTAGRIWSQLGLLHLRAGETEAALAAFADAGPRLAGDHEHLARVHLNRGILHLQVHRPTEAAADFTRSSDEYAAAGLESDRGKAEHNLGYAQLLRGDLVDALKRMDAGARAMAPLTPVMRSVLEQDRAEVLLAAGRTREAIASLEAAVAAYRVRRLPRFQAECELVLARTLLQEDPTRARTLARRAAARFADHDADTWAQRASALALSAAIANGSRARSMLGRADDLASRLRSGGHPRDAERLALYATRLAVRRGELGDAARRLGPIRVGPRTPIATRLLDREVRTELAIARGRPDRARAHARSGLADLHAWQASFGSLDLQSTVAGHGNHLARLGLGLALEDGRPEVLLEWSERARALASQVAPVRPPRDPVLAADLAELRSLGEDDPARRDRLRERIRQQGWYGDGPGAVGEPVEIDDLRSCLAPLDAALVAHVAVDGRLTALVVGAEDAHVVPLGPVEAVRGLLDRAAADLDVAATHADGPLASVVRGSLDASLSEAADLLVAPLLPRLGDRRVVLTPSAILAGTPWSLLPGLRGRPVTVARSATGWQRGVRESPAGRRAGLVAGPGVTRAAEEVAQAARAWPGAEVLLGADASARRVSDLAGRVDVLHLAGHGRHTGDNPLFSAVELTDGPWFGYDIDLLPSMPSLVVLSACELGRVSVRSGEETVGMTAAWLHAGARTVLSATSLVADTAACEGLAAWHGLVADGVPPADALASVVTDRPADTAPLPFCCFGAGW